MADLGVLLKHNPRTVWPREACDFTPWLADHLDELGAVIGMDLELVRRECDAGDFSIDLLARDLSGSRDVVIENQLTQTDHTHLGQAITYAAHKDAGVVVWVCREFREEHRAALEWLNRGLQAKTEFYGVVVEILQIDESRPAVNFRVVAAPANRSVRGARPDDEGPSERAQRYQVFFQRLIDELREKHHFTNARGDLRRGDHARFNAGLLRVGRTEHRLCIISDLPTSVYDQIIIRADDDWVTATLGPWKAPTCSAEIDVAITAYAKGFEQSTIRLVVEDGTVELPITYYAD